MIRWLKKLLGLEELQKAHDLRAVFNERLRRDNERLRKELGQRGPLKPKAQAHFDRQAAEHAERMALMRVAHQRKEIMLYEMSNLLPLAQVRGTQDAANGMTDEQVMAWTRPKRTNPT